MSFWQLPFPYSTLQVILSELVFRKRKVHPFCFIFHQFALWVSTLRYFSQMGIYLHIFFILRSEKMSKRKGCSNQLSDKRIKAMSNAKLDSHIKNELMENNGTMMKIIKVQKERLFKPTLWKKGKNFIRRKSGFPHPKWIEGE